MVFIGFPSGIQAKSNRFEALKTILQHHSMLRVLHLKFPFQVLRTVGNISRYFQHSMGNILNIINSNEKNLVFKLFHFLVGFILLFGSLDLFLHCWYSTFFWLIKEYLPISSFMLEILSSIGMCSVCVCAESALPMKGALCSRNRNDCLCLDNSKFKHENEDGFVKPHLTQKVMG